MSGHANSMLIVNQRCISWTTCHRVVMFALSCSSLVGHFPCMCKSCCFSKNKFLRYGPRANLFLYSLRFLTFCSKIISTSVITPTEFKALGVSKRPELCTTACMKTALICTHRFSSYSFWNRLGNAPNVSHTFWKRLG